MAFLETHFHSKELNKQVTANVILPEVNKKKPGCGKPEGTYKTLYLLHGKTGDYSLWMRRTSIERYAAEYGIAVVMPDAANSWYTNTFYGANYFNFMTEELPAVCRSYFSGMSDKREDNFVMGLSMCGYGALKIALNCPDKYFACASFSGAVEIMRKGFEVDLQEWRSVFDFQLQSADELEGGPHDLYALARQKKAEGVDFPKFYIWCGTEDRWVTKNRILHEVFEEEGIAHTYAESTGDHTWPYWDEQIQVALKLFLGEK